MATETKARANDIGSLMVESLLADVFKDRLDEAVQQHPNRVKIIEPGFEMAGTYYTDAKTSEFLLYGQHLDRNNIEFNHIVHITKTSQPNQPLEWKAVVVDAETYNKVLDKWLA